VLDTKESEILSSFSADRSPRAKFASVVRLLWENRRPIAICTAVFALVSVGVVLILPPRYLATTTILPAPVPSASSDLSRMLRPDVVAMANLTGITSSPDQGRFLALLQSRILAERVVTHFDLQHVYQARRMSDARRALSSHTDIQEDRRSGVITIAVSDRDPRRCAQIADGYVQELDSLNNQLNASGAHLERVFLETRVEEVGKELSQASQQLSQFSAKNSMLDTTEQSRSTVSAAMQLQGQIIAAESDFKGLEEIYQSDSIKVRTAKAKLAELNRQLAAIHGNKTEDVGDFPSIRNLPALGLTYNDLARRVKLLEIVQTALTEQLEMAKTDEAKSIPSFRVLDPAEVPDYREFPKRTSTVLICTAIGFGVGMVFVVLRNRWQAVDGSDPVKQLVFDAWHGVRRHTTLLWQPRSSRDPGLHDVERS
jgi:tyrosine-protein kinase Etk/Wzc